MKKSQDIDAEQNKQIQRLYVPATRWLLSNIWVVIKQELNN